MEKEKNESEKRVRHRERPEEKRRELEAGVEMKTCHCTSVLHVNAKVICFAEDLLYAIKSNQTHFHIITQIKG